MILDERVAREIEEIYKRLEGEGELLSKTQLEKYYETFKQRFGPNNLKALDGQELLDTMHNHGNRDSLVYWLEFKNDEEFPAHFGGIGGGSALKFGIYRRAETGAWMAGSPQSQRELTTDEAIEYAKKHRDDLIKGAELLEQFPKNAADKDYEKLQQDMERLAPSIVDTAWGHKYLSLLYPDKLDDYHSADYQRFHLIKLLQIPPKGKGRYVAAGRFIAIANELGIPINSFTTITNYRHGRPHKYWRIGTSDGRQPRNQWALMRDNNCVAIGWDKLGDLSTIKRDRQSKEKIRQLMQTQYPSTPQEVGRETQQVFSFIAAIGISDLVLASDGLTVLGIGKISGEYHFAPSSSFQQRRPVQWLKLEEWNLPETEGLRKAVYEIRNENNMVEIEKHLVQAIAPPGAPRYWIEKTIVKGRPDRQSGEYALGKALWSPQPDRRGADIYKFMREVKPNDLILHLTDNRGFTGASRVTTSYEEFNGVANTEWGLGSSYIIRLADFIRIDPPLLRETFFASPFREQLIELIDSGQKDLFYTREPSLNQGSYLTPAPTELVEILNEAYLKISGQRITDIVPPKGVTENTEYTLKQCAQDTGFDEEQLERWVSAIERKGQAIIYGPPGTGKTYLAEKLARHLIGGGDGAIEIIQFHPSYAYEDFIQGIRPQDKGGGGLYYPLVPGRFLEFCRKAEHLKGRCVLIIDEINRANLARVFGEVMYLLEYRDREVPLSGGGLFKIPSNIRMIGTMNTADRSIALVDYALRRRFAFLALYPRYDILRRYHEGTDFPLEKLIQILEHLNRRIADRHFEVGVTFFLRKRLSDEIKDIWQMEIEPYLEEYFFDQPATADEFRWDTIKDRLFG